MANALFLFLQDLYVKVQFRWAFWYWKINLVQNSLFEFCSEMFYISRYALIFQNVFQPLLFFLSVYFQLLPSECDVILSYADLVFCCRFLGFSAITTTSSLSSFILSSDPQCFFFSLYIIIMNSFVYIPIVKNFVSTDSFTQFYCFIICTHWFCCSYRNIVRESYVSSENLTVKWTFESTVSRTLNTCYSSRTTCIGPYYFYLFCI